MESYTNYTFIALNKMHIRKIFSNTTSSKEGNIFKFKIYWQIKSNFVKWECC